MASPRAQQMVDRAYKLSKLRGQWMEALVVNNELTAYADNVQGVYRRPEERRQAAIVEERQAELTRQQGLLLFLGGMQQFSNSLQQQQQYNQQQQHYNQQQMYQQQILHELMKPTTCHSYGATTTCD